MTEVLKTKLVLPKWISNAFVLFRVFRAFSGSFFWRSKNNPRITRNDTKRWTLYALCSGKTAFCALVLLLASAAGAFGQTPAPSPEAPLDIPVPAIAPDYKPDDRPLPELGRVGVDMGRQSPLTLREALTLALENNKDIEVARHNVKIAEFDLTTARGAYDPRFISSAYHERIENPISSFLSGASDSVSQANYTAMARLAGLTPKFGGNYNLDFSSVRLTTNNQFAALNPQYPTGLTFNYTQPLWRGLRFDNSRRQIEIARKSLSLTDAQFRQRAIETITNVQRAYWDLVFALRNLQVQRDAVRDSRAQLEHNKRLVEEGSLAPIDIVAAEAQLAGFEQDLFTSLEEVSRTENNLKNLISENRQSEIWNLSIVPTDPVALTTPQISLPDALKSAMENRLELQQSNLAQEINRIDQKYFRDQTKPAVDLVGSYGLVGLAGSINPAGNNPFAGSNLQLRERIDVLSQLNGLPPLPVQPVQEISDNLIGGFNQSLQNLFSNQFNNFRVGVQVSLPLRNRTAEGQLGRALVEGDRLATQREQLEQLIQVDVRNALQVVRSGEARLRAAAIARDASEQQYQSERRKLDAGQSTVFLVLERQTALTAARRNELRAQTELNKAIAELHRATGNALTTHQIVVRTK
ncbi:MAG TPA: TolC family protein [Pyrinomonadaceae bacterium]|nr:TolC family protein [Pyrinomonadaceae bacterium]